MLIVDDSRIFRAALETSLSEQEGHRGRRLGIQRPEGAGVHPGDAARRGDPGRRDAGHGRTGDAQGDPAIQCRSAPGTEVGVVMVSAYTKRGADVTMRAAAGRRVRLCHQADRPSTRKRICSTCGSNCGSKIQHVRGRPEPQSGDRPNAAAARRDSRPARPRRPTTRAACNGRACGRSGPLSSRPRPAARRPWKRWCPISAAASICRC